MNSFALEVIKCGDKTGCENDKEIKWFLNEISFGLYKQTEHIDYIIARDSDSNQAPLYREDKF